MRLRKRLARWLLIGAAAVVVAALGMEIAIRAQPLPASLGKQRATLVVVDRQGAFLAETGDGEIRSCRPVGIAAVSPWVIRATLAAEDRRFHSHVGVDFRALCGAVWRNVRSGEVVSGASTITQQLIKLHSESEGRGWAEKISENLTALKLERAWGKGRILEAYLNRIDYGNGLRGIEAAAQGYFGKAAADLEPSEAVFLAGLPQAPSRYNPWSNPNAAEARYRKVISFLRRDGCREMSLFKKTPAIIPRGSREGIAPHFVRRVVSKHASDGGIVTTTLDSKLQESVNAIVGRHFQRLSKLRARQIAVLVMDHSNGAVRAWCGSSSWQGSDGQLDGVLIPRSSGSTLKPFLYLHAIDTGLITAATLLPDTPDAIRAEYPDYDPRNFDQRFWGPVRARDALGNSLNVPAVHVLAKVGARPFFRYLLRSGIPLQGDLDDYGAGMILGNGEVRMLDLAAAFGAFANLGIHAAPRLTENSPARHTAISSPRAATILADMLSDNGARLKTFGARSPLAFEKARIPCKTGTSSGFHDAWTVGATGRHVVAVWVGNFDGKAMDEVASVTGPAPIWREIIDILLPEDGGVEIDAEMEGLEKADICSLSGLRWTEQSPGNLSELFLTGSAPKEYAASFFRNGKIILPPEFALWCRSGHNYLAAGIAIDGPLRIISPLDGSTFLIDPGLPRGRQQIELIAAGGDAEMIWEIDGRKLEPDESGNTFWPLSEGSHRLKAVSGDASAESVFSVK